MLEITGLLRKFGLILFTLSSPFSKGKRTERTSPIPPEQQSLPVYKASRKNRAL